MKRKNISFDIQIDNLTEKNINPYESEELTKIITMAFDIECDSSHGDFPNPIKDFKKLAIDIHEEYFRQSIHLTSEKIKISFIKNCIINSLNNSSDFIQSIELENGPYSKKSLDLIRKILIMILYLN